MSNLSGVAVGGKEANRNGGIQVDASDAAAPEVKSSWDKDASLKLRLLRAQEAVAVLELDVTVKGETRNGGKYQYQGISAAQVIARAKAALISNGILYTPCVRQESVKIDGNKTSLWVDGYFENVDDPDGDEETGYVVRGAWGSGTDNADNGYAKAFTNANKQILAKTLNMTTVEDEKTEEVQHEPDSARAIVKEAEKAQGKTLQAWAASFKAALTKAGTIKEINDLQRANKDQLMAEELPEVTRDFFIELIQQRKELIGGGDAA